MRNGRIDRVMTMGVRGVGLTVFSVSRKELNMVIKELQEAIKHDVEDVTLRFKDIDITLLIE